MSFEPKVYTASELHRMSEMQLRTAAHGAAVRSRNSDQGDQQALGWIDQELQLLRELERRGVPVDWDHA